MNEGKVGTHALINLLGVDSDLIYNNEAVKNKFLKSAESGGFSIIKPFFHEFKPIGFTGILLLSESHMSIHTWPEYNYIAVDVFSCSKTASIDKTIKTLLDEFKPDKIEKKIVKR